MAKVRSIVYQTDEGSTVNYEPINPDELDTESMKALLRLVDGEDIQDVIEDYL